MSNSVRQIVIVGGGTAGWITAGLLAATHGCSGDSGIELTVIESPDIAPIGVGEGTWPSMRATLRRMGIAEADFIRECDASFKQGSQFRAWRSGSRDDHYHHPFTLPLGYGEINLAGHWQARKQDLPFAAAVCPQPGVAELGLAPKQISTPEYAGNLNYGYHLDSVKFSALLRTHCMEHLGVRHVLDKVTAVQAMDNGDIRSVRTASGSEYCGDLFVDCSGFAALLIGKHLQVPYRSRQSALFNDTALAVQVPYSQPGDPFASSTLATACAAGWIWDIGLPTRRGVGYVYSSAHTSEEAAVETLRQYLRNYMPGEAVESITPRRISINPGHREVFWHHNCVAIGMAAGFIEPLEASALVLVEQSATLLSDRLPATRAVMDISARRFNAKMTYHWDRIVDFLKLHYVLSQRSDTPYWRDHRDSATMPESLQELLQLWQHQYPWLQDAPQIDELFPAASFQYVLYGMGFKTSQLERPAFQQERARADTLFDDCARSSQRLYRALPGNRELIDKVKSHGLSRI